MSQSQPFFSQLPEIASLEMDKDGMNRLSPIEHEEYLGSQLGLGSTSQTELLPLSQPQLDPILTTAVRPASPPHLEPPPATLVPSAPPFKPVPMPGLLHVANTMVPLQGPMQGHMHGPLQGTNQPPSFLPGHLIYVTNVTNIQAPPNVTAYLDVSGKAPPRPSHHSMLKAEHRNSRANRRGPMDDMRQLVRILVKLMPNSAPLLVEDGSGGNRVSEAQIQGYLKRCLGDAPKPEWGIPNGWGTYLAELFGWVLGRVVSKDEAMLCARRQPGRSWETVESELVKMGLYPASWKLPLSQAEVQEANRLQLERGPALSEEAPGSPLSDAPSQSTRNVAEALHLLRNENEQPRKKKRRKARDTTATSSPDPVSCSHGMDVFGNSLAGLAAAMQTTPPQPEPAAATSAPSVDLGCVDDVSQLTVEQCWQQAARCLQSAAERDGSAPKERHGQLALLHGFVLQILGRDFQFLSSMQGDAATAGRQGGAAAGADAAGEDVAAAAAQEHDAAARQGAWAASLLGMGAAAAALAAPAANHADSAAGAAATWDYTTQPAPGGRGLKGMGLGSGQPPMQSSAEEPETSHAWQQQQQQQQQRATPSSAAPVKSHVETYAQQTAKGLQDMRNSLLVRIERAAESQGGSQLQAHAARQSVPMHHHMAAPCAAATADPVRL